MGAATAGPKLLKKKISKPTMNVGVGSKKKSPPTPTVSLAETKLALEFLKTYYGAEDDSGHPIPPTPEAIQKRIQDVRNWNAQSDRPVYPPVECGEPIDEYLFPEHEITEDERPQDLKKEYILSEDWYEEDALE